MVRYFVIAARNRSDLYAYLRRQFSADDNVQVLLDRRREERRRRQESHEPDRRRGDRRSQRGKDDWLHYYGLLIVRQLSEVGWRPSRLGSGTPEELVGFDSQPRVEGAKAIEAHERVIEWLTEGQRLTTLVPKLLQEHGHLTARSEAAERKCERLEREIKSLRGENEYFRKERRQVVEALKALAKQLVESAGEQFQ
jgi:ribosomal protein S16